MKLIDIVKRYIFENKKNTLLIITSIIISTALFLVMNIISEDARNLMVDQAKKELGAKHASYSNPTNKDIDYIKNSLSIEKFGTSMLLGLHDMGNSQTLQIVSDDENAQELSESYKLKEGSFPVNENEIAIDKYYIEQKNIDNAIGKTIKLDYTRQDEDGNILYEGEKEFKITGILNSNKTLKAQGMLMALITQESAYKNIPIENKHNQIVFKFKEEKNIQNQVASLVDEGNLIDSNIRINDPLISAMSDSIILKIPYIIGNIVLALATILLIYNIFYILVSSRTKDFGVLRALGFVPLDVSKIMILEVLIYVVISIPVGLGLGGLVSNLLSRYIIGGIYDINYVNSLKSDSYINAYIVSCMLSVITVIISVAKPLIICSKIDPMICIKRNEEKITIKQKSFINIFMNKFFNDCGNIASKNLQRNKKRTNLAIASMTMVVFLMMTIYTQLISNNLNEDSLRSWIPGDYLIHNIDMALTNDNVKSYDSSILKEIENIDGIEMVNASRVKEFNISIDDKNIEKESKYWKESKKSLEMRAEIKDGTKVYKNSFEVIGIEDTSILNNVLIDGKENLNKLKDNPYVYIDEQSSEALNIQKGNKLNVNFEIIDFQTNEYEKTLSKEFIVGGIIKNLPLASPGGGPSLGAIMSVEQMNKFVGVSSYERFDIWNNKMANIQHVDNELNKIIEKEGKGTLISYVNESANIENSNNQETMIVVLVAVIIIILSLFNCCNTMVTSINSRCREFALLRGIGISRDEINKIVKLEGLIYISVGFVIAIVPSLIVRIIIIMDRPNIDLINLEFIGVTITIYILLLLITRIIISKTLKHTQSENFIEQIKILE